METKNLKKYTGYYLAFKDLYRIIETEEGGLCIYPIIRGFKGIIDLKDLKIFINSRLFIPITEEEAELHKILNRRNNDEC